MCHLCCISFPFPHLFPARCASEITALHAEAGARRRQRPRQPYRRLPGREEIRKFAEIFGQQNKHFPCQAPNRQLGEPASICPAPLAQPSGQRCPPSRRGSPAPARSPAPYRCVPLARDAPNDAAGSGSGAGTPAQLPPLASQHGTMGAAPRAHGTPCPPAGPRHVPDPRGGCQDGSGAGGCSRSVVPAGRGVCEAKRGRGPVLFARGRRTPVTQPAAAFLPTPGTEPPESPSPSCRSPSAEAGLRGAPHPMCGGAGAGAMLRHGALRSLDTATLQATSSTRRALRVGS